MDITCGTNNVRTIKDFNISDYGVIELKDNVSDDQKKTAILLIEETMDTVTFISSGHRNDDAVNMCIALYVLGYDPVKWFENFFHAYEDLFYGADVDFFYDHVTRVIPYLPEWGPENDRGNALYYRCD